MMGSMMRRGSFGDGAALNLDFTSMSSTADLTALGFTFSRSTSGTYLGADGLVKTAGTNVARFDYDTSGTPLGLSIEGSATNLLAHTERLDEAQVSTEQYWVTSYTATGVTASVTGPDGVSNSSTQFAPIGGNGTCIASAAMGSSAQRSFSFWAKRSSGSTNLEYTLDNGTNWVAVTTTSSWQRFTIAATTAAQRVGFRFASNNVYEIWGCQLEVGSGSSSYIKNVSAAGGASRAADFCYMSGISSWFNAPTGTIISKVTYSALTGSNAGIELSVGTGSSGTNRIAIRKSYVDYYSGGGAAQAEMYPTVTSGAVQIGTAYAANDFAMCSNGGTMRTDSIGSVPIGLDTLKLYSDAGSSSGLFLNGWMRSFKYFPTRLSNAQLQSLTT